MGAALQPHVDVFLGETLSTIDEAKMAITGVQDYGKPVMVSFTLRSDGALRSATRSWTSSASCCASRPSRRRACSCTRCSLTAPNLRRSRGRCARFKPPDGLMENLAERDVRVGAYANRLTAIADDWALAESVEPQAMRADLDVAQYVEYVNTWVNMGARIIGGCCGIGPEYIAQIHETLKQRGLQL
ncbi:hypothetical protein PINS_up021645 [Pythium insidiosum]|nr:hypothetical protein PINS_up021645 [Pythium insidiosum]